MGRLPQFDGTFDPLGNMVYLRDGAKCLARLETPGYPPVSVRFGPEVPAPFLRFAETGYQSVLALPCSIVVGW